MGKVAVKARRQRNEDRLEKWVDNGSTGDSLFNENARNPRVVTGRSTSQRRQQKSGDSSLRPQAAGNQGTRAPTRNETQTPGTTGGGAKSGAPPPAAPSPGATNRGGAAEPNKGASGFQNNDSAAPSRSTTHLPPQLGPNTTLRPGTGQRGQLPSTGFTLNPKGTLQQQLKALKRYQQHLKRYRQKLRRHHRAFVNRAKQLRRRRR